MCAACGRACGQGQRPFHGGPRSRSSRRPCGSSVRGASPIKASLSSGSKRTKKADSWFYGLGFWTRANAEVCLLATKGHPKRQAADIHQFIISPIEAHSKKPDETRDKIVALMGDRPRVELFARQTPPGWGRCGATRWSRQRASGHGGQKIAERRMFLALCECSQRSVKGQDQTCL